MCTVPVSPVICVSLHDALPILTENGVPAVAVAGAVRSKWSSPAGDTETLAEPVFVVSTVSLTVIVWEPAVVRVTPFVKVRSEERRVGKGWCYGWVGQGSTAGKW